MNFEDCALYIYAEDPVWEAPKKFTDHLLNINENYDYVGSYQPVFYDGMGKLDEDCRFDFESTGQFIRKHMLKYLHHNISFLDYVSDELLKNVAEDLEDVSAGKESLYVGDVSFLLGEHEILAIENKRIIKTQFSFMFACMQSPKDDLARLTKALRADGEFMEHFGDLEAAIGTSCNFIMGPA